MSTLGAWDNPEIYDTINITKVENLSRNRPAYAQISNDILYFFSGTNEVFVYNVSTPLTPTFISKFYTNSTIQDMRVIGDRLYLACGKNGIFTFNITNNRNITFESAYSSSIYDSTAIVPLSENFVYVGDDNGTIQLLNITDPHNVLIQSSFTSYPVRTLCLHSNALIVGTMGFGQEIYDISEPTLPLLKYNTRNETSSHEALETFLFDVTAIFNEGPFEGIRRSTIQSYWKWTAMDPLNITQENTASIWTQYFFLYNDTNEDGILTYNITWDKYSKNFAKTYTFTDEIYAIPIFKCSSVEYTDPKYLDYKGNLALYFNVTFNQWQLNSTGDPTATQDIPDFPTIDNPELNISFDLTYTYWIYSEADTYKLKIDTLIDNVNMNFGAQNEPKNLKMFCGFKTAVHSIFGTTEMPIPTSIASDGGNQTFYIQDKLMALSMLEKTYVLKNSTGEMTYECDTQYIPQLFDIQFQKIVGDADHVYNFVVGANFDVNSDVERIIYDPDTNFFSDCVPIDNEHIEDEHIEDEHIGGIYYEGVIYYVLFGAVIGAIAVIIVFIKKRRS
ncbi:MAG: hypothetical protein ACTSPW_10185 [Promethearchaeota archaeon]